MPVKEPGGWPFEFIGNPEDFESPFPSTDTAPLQKLATLTTEAYSVGRQATSYKNALQLTMKAAWSSPMGGGIRQQWLDKVAWEVEGDRPGEMLMRGMFADFQFPETTSASALRDQAIRFGLKTAQNLLSAVPMVGGILSAAVDIGKFFYRLSQRGEEVIPVIVPWTEYSQGTDTQFVRLLAGQTGPSVDWTALFRPALRIGEIGTSSYFQILPTKKAGETRAYGVFTGSGAADYRSPATGDEPGMGFMPGTRRMADVVQISKLWGGAASRTDAVTSIGDFTPSGSQFCDAAWQMVNKAGSSDMYKVKVAELIEDWTAYFDRFYGNGLELVQHYRAKKSPEAHISALFAAKALLRFVLAKNGEYIAENWLASAGNLQAFVGPGFFESDNPFQQPGWGSYSRIDEQLILPALRALKQRQKTMLARSLACAYVRPRTQDGNRLPRFAAFADTGPAEDPAFNTWGEELTAYCEDMRELFLDDTDRYLVRNEDAIDADPKFGRELANSKSLAPELDLAGVPLDVEPLDPLSAIPAVVNPPGGSGPFGSPGKKKKTRKKGAGVGVALAVGGIAAVAVLKG